VQRLHTPELRGVLWTRDEPVSAGKVFIVGAGPGDPELLTIKAVKALENADVVLYDRLVAAAILELIPSSAERVYVGKNHGEQDSVQTEIMVLLERYALARTWCA
jgi:siroheme synthase